jgi:hypothetical protein
VLSVKTQALFVVCETKGCRKIELMSARLSPATDQT